MTLEPIEIFPFGGKKSNWQNEFSLLKSGGRCPKAQKAGDKIGVSGRARGGIRGKAVFSGQFCRRSPLPRQAVSEMSLIVKFRV